VFEELWYLWLGMPPLLLAVLGLLMFRMPGRSFSGEAPPLCTRQRAMAGRMATGLRTLALEHGPRHLRGREAQLARTADWIEGELTAMGYQVHRERFEVEGQSACNLVVERPGSGERPEWLVVGAHYDTVPDSPGANDNGSGVVACLELARAFAQRDSRYHLRFVFFVNEEAPWFMTRSMGALVHAQGCKDRQEPVMAMLCLECVGCYIDLPGSQLYPPPLERLYPNRGDFVAFVGNMKSQWLVHRTVRVFRRHATLPSEGLAGWETALKDVGRSDHKAFWSKGYKAVMITDTANFRDRRYHTPLDLPGNVDTTAMARLVTGLEQVIGELVKSA
jgi:hypothetical protein